MERLQAEILVAGALAVAAQFLVLYWLGSLIRLPLWVLAVILPILWLGQWIAAPLLLSRNLIEVTRDPNYSWLADIVAKTAAAAGIPTPRVYISREPYPNAFAFGNRLMGYGVAVTAPLLEVLTREELESVIAHEIGHVKHRDIELALAFGLVPSMLGLIGWLLMRLGGALISTEEGLLILFGILAIAAAVGLIAATIFINIFVLWLNRLRELYADLHAVKTLGPMARNLATALAKIEVYMANVSVDPIKGPVLTVPTSRIKETDPNELLTKWARENPHPLDDIFSTHPHTAKRVRFILREIDKF